MEINHIIQIPFNTISNVFLKTIFRNAFSPSNFSTGIIYKLEKIETSLNKSRVALTKNLDKRRNKNAIFSMLSQEETFFLLCKSNIFSFFNLSYSDGEI